MHVELTHDFVLESAHSLPNVPEGHKCRRVHGHNFVVQIHVEGEVDAKTGWLMDYAEIHSRFEPLRRQLDHRLLNEVEGLENPTSENLARWIWDRLRPELPQLTEIVVCESSRSRCRYRGE